MLIGPARAPCTRRSWRRWTRRWDAVLDTLDAQGIADDTIVLFFSDNGGAAYAMGGADNVPLRGGKGETFEGGIRVVSVMRWPAQIEGGHPHGPDHVGDGRLPDAGRSRRHRAAERREPSTAAACGPRSPRAKPMPREDYALLRVRDPDPGLVQLTAPSTTSGSSCRRSSRDCCRPTSRTISSASRRRSLRVQQPGDASTPTSWPALRGKAIRDLARRCYPIVGNPLGP